MSDLKSELKSIFKLAYPIALAQVGLMTLSLVDTAVVGRSSTIDLAGAAIGRSISFLVVSAGMGIPMSLEALATQAIGAGEPHVAWSALRGALRTSAVACLPITIVSIAICFLLVPLGVEPEVASRALSFVLGNAPGAFGFLVFLAAKTFLQAHGRTSPALVAALVANVFNFFVCNVLVLGDDALHAIGLPGIGLPRLGALGAGLSSSLGALLLGALTFLAAERLRPSDPDARHAPLSMKRIASIGLPIGLQLLAEVGVFSVVALVAGRLGSRVVSAHQIAIAVASTTFMVVLGISGATAVHVGVAVGGGQSPRRIGFVGTGLGLAFMSISAIAFHLLPEMFVRPFSTDERVRSMAIQLLHIAAVFQLFDATQGVLAGALRGAGDVRFPFVVMLVGYWAVAFPLALLLGFGLGWGATGLWWGLTAGLLLVAVLLFARFWVVTSRRVERV